MNRMKRYYLLFSVALFGMLTIFGSATTLKAQSYCIPQNASGCLYADYVQSFSFANISNNNSGCNNLNGQGYSYFNTLTATTFAGQTYNYSITITPTYSEGLAAWADYNGNGVFETSERFYASTGTLAPGTTVTGTATIPAGATAGTWRIRVRVGYATAGTAIDPCTPTVTNEGESEDYNIQILSGSITNVWPGGVNFPNITANPTVLEVGMMFDGSSAAFPRPSAEIDRLNVSGYSQRFTYAIVVENVAGLSPGTVMYEMRDPSNPSSKVIPVPAGSTKLIYAAENASGPMASGTNGNFSTIGAVGGTYKTVAVHELLSNGSVVSTQTYEKIFNIAVNRDISVSSIESPLPARRQSYIGSVPIRGRFRNVGLRAITRYMAYYEIRNAVSGALIKSDSVERSTDQGGGLPSTGLLTAIDDEVLFPSFATVVPDSFCVVLKAKLISTDDNPFAVDQQTFNDRFPQTDCGYKFRMWYLTDFEARSLTSPGSSLLYTGRPIKPIAIIANNGLNVDAIPVQMTATLNGNVVAQSTTTVEVPSGSYNIFPAQFEEFIPSQPGTLEICIETFAAGDQYAPNNKSCYTFTINGRLNGTYTIGTVPQAGRENFTTVQSAINALYSRGVEGPVTFLFTDASYQVSGTNSFEPAIDLTSNIIGVGPNNPVVFRPDPNSVGLLRGGVTVQLNSPNGIGVMFGQSSTPSNPNAVYREFATKANANYPGYITFDGGSQKSLRFRLKTPANRKAVFYFGTRTYNTTVKNCLIEMDPSTPETEFWSTIPRVSIDQSNLLFGRDSNTATSVPEYFSAGVVQRNIPPADEFGVNRRGLDTVIIENNITYRGNKENKIQNNEITGFGIGVMSLGMGVLKERNKLVRYYNTGTEISGNRISKVGRTGIFLGYEDGAKISRNKIYNVQGIFIFGTSTYVFDPVSGIEAGLVTDTLSATLGYNNINTEISYNEINDVRSYYHSRGILVNQSQCNYGPTGILENALQPNVAEKTKIIGNAIFDLRRGVVFPTGAIVRYPIIHRTGIQLTTDRTGGWTSSLSATNLASYINPRQSFNPTKDARRYFTREDLVANNTVLIQDDSITTNGAAVGIAIQNASNARMMNNAVAVTAPLNVTAIANGFPNTAFFYSGVLPSYSGGLKSNYNVAWPASNIAGTWSLQGSFMRFVEMDTLSQVLLASCQDEYRTRDQWYNWTGQDDQSFVGNFVSSRTDTLKKLGQEPVVNLRQIANTGSILNNSGTNLTEVTTDIDGEVRGSANNRYDIGADEYSAIPYLNDVEVLAVVAPRAYRSGGCTYTGNNNATSGPYSDVEYITVDTNSVPVMVRVRNNSTLSQTINLSGSLAMEAAATSGNAAPTYGTPTTINTVSVTISGGETRDVMLGRVNLQTLSEVGTGYTSPTWMQQAVDASMRPNVTPRYQVRAYIATFNSDENRFNDTNQTESRFYIRQASTTKFMVSLENSGYPHITTSPTATGYASATIGRLNSDSLKIALDSLGFFSNPSNNSNNRPFRYDILDRTGWEAKTFDYTPYKMLLWSQDNNALVRTERDQLRKYLAAGNQQIKKNLIMSSEAVVTNHIGLNATADQFFVREQLRANVSTAATGAVQATPFTNGYVPSVVTNGQSFVDGIFVQRGLSELVRATGFVNGTFTDPNPKPSMMKVYTDSKSKGYARTAFKFRHIESTVAVKDSTMGITTTAPTWNVIFYGLDWRHFAKTGNRTGLERVLRGSFDHVQFNDGRVTPVELVEFDARRSGSSVSLDWATASEQNSGWYEVERAVKSNEEMSFERIATVPASGNSTSRREYTTVDNNVRSGSTYIYRLRMVDRDGSFEYSDEVAVLIGDGSNNGLSITESRPNPVTGVATFDYSVANAGTVSVILTDMIGRELSTIFTGSVSAGTHTLEVSADALATGMYQIVIKSGDAVATRSMQVVK